MYTLPVMPPGTYNCPADFGPHYTLDFYNNSTLIAHAVADASGCRTVLISNEKTRWSVGANDTGFFNDIQKIFPSTKVTPK